MDEQLLKLPEYDELVDLYSGYADSKAGISPIEIEHLSWLAYHVPAGGDIVEIGSHRGKSICAMGCACRLAGNNARLFAVDLWTKGKGTFEHYHSEETWILFQAQVEKMGLRESIRPVVSSSANAAKYRRKPIHLLFIDNSRI